MTLNINIQSNAIGGESSLKNKDIIIHDQDFHLPFLSMMFPIVLRVSKCWKWFSDID